MPQHYLISTCFKLFFCTFLLRKKTAVKGEMLLILVSFSVYGEIPYNLKHLSPAGFHPFRSPGSG